MWLVGMVLHNEKCWLTCGESTDGPITHLSVIYTKGMIFGSTVDSPPDLPCASCRASPLLRLHRSVWGSRLLVCVCLWPGDIKVLKSCCLSHFQVLLYQVYQSGGARLNRSGVAATSPVLSPPFANASDLKAGQVWTWDVTFMPAAS